MEGNINITDDEEKLIRAAAHEAVMKYM